MEQSSHREGREGGVPWPADGESLVVGRFQEAAASAAALAVRGLAGMLFGGVAIEVFVMDERCHEAVWAAATEQEGQASGGTSARNAADEAPAAIAVSVLYLDNIVLSDECEDEDEATETLSELAQLCSGAVQGPCRPVACWLQFRATSKADETDAEADAKTEMGERAVSACVSFASFSEAEAVRAALNGRVLGGRAIVATVEDAGMISSEVIASITPPPVIQAAQSVPSSIAAAASAAADAADAAKASPAEPVSKYAAAKTAPRQAKRSGPAVKVGKAAGEGQDQGDGEGDETGGKAGEAAGRADGETGDAPTGLTYSLLSLCTPVAPATIEDSIKLLLKALATFQVAALQRDPLKARYNKRFVLGMKQVTNAIRAGNARLVLLPPDIEESLVMDKMVQTLLHEADKREIPVVYCLSRRRLGKALDNTMRQSAAAVYNPDGAYGDFKRVMAWYCEEKLALDAVRAALCVCEEECLVEAARECGEK